MIIEDNSCQQELPNHTESDTSRTSKLFRAISQARRGAFGTSRLILFNLLLLFTFGKVIEILADQLDQHPSESVHLVPSLLAAYVRWICVTLMRPVTSSVRSHDKTHHQL